MMARLIPLAVFVFVVLISVKAGMSQSDVGPRSEEHTSELQSPA